MKMVLDESGFEMKVVWDENVLGMKVVLDENFWEFHPNLDESAPNRRLATRHAIQAFDKRQPSQCTLWQACHHFHSTCTNTQSNF